MLFKKLKQEIESLRWKVQALEEKNKDLKKNMESTIETLRSQLVAIKKGEEISDRVILEGLPYQPISAEEIPIILEKYPESKILDVRTKPEFDSGYIPNAIHIPIDELTYRWKEKIGESSFSFPIISYCASGARSQVACEILLDQGFQNVFHVDGSLSAYPHALQSLSTNSPMPIRKEIGRKSPEEEALKESVQKILKEEVNPAVASHGGFIEIIEVKDKDIYLLMGGGCQGCGMAAATLKQGVEEMLRKSIPGLGKVFDHTDHASGENPYYS